MPPATMPWAMEACFTRLLMHDATNKPSFHKVDLFHTVQLGQGKAFAASALVSLLPLFGGDSVDARLASLTQHYKQYCKVSSPRIITLFVCSCLIISLWLIFFEMNFNNKSSQEHGENAYLSKICKETLNCKGSKDLPEAHWSRGAVTTTMLRFIQAFCVANHARLTGNESFELIAPLLAKEWFSDAKLWGLELKSF